MRDNLIQIRSFGAGFYALRDSNGIHLIDCGFIGGVQMLHRALRKRGWGKDPILGIIVTHGHLDHILNVSRIAAETGAWIAAPRHDAAHYEGNPTYHGAAKVTGFLESAGRPVLGFKPFTTSRLLEDGDTMDVWHGLTVVHLPGHTAGHSGFYSHRLRWLFCADLFASYGGLSHFPPHFLNMDSKQAYESASRALELDLAGVLPSHADGASPEVHLQRLKKLVERQSGDMVKP
ncbi:MAG: MBL fold metallo-hydrolase [Chthoniobacterales bacterium]|nr:MBL fold metallo-hydrolase [Chthoniobacterales bacterium]